MTKELIVRTSGEADEGSMMNCVAVPKLGRMRYGWAVIFTEASLFETTAPIEPTFTIES